jgi:excisionase family DNA binding protein
MRQDAKRRPPTREPDNPQRVGASGPPALPPRYLTPEEIAALFGVPLETVYQWRRKHTGPPAFRVGRHLRYDPAVVAEWVAQQTEKEA